MWPFSIIKKNWREDRIKAIHRQAADDITISDFNSRIYIAFMGNPLVLLDENLTAKEVFDRLVEVRENFIDAKTRNSC